MPLSGQVKQMFEAAVDRLKNFYEGQRPYDPADNPGGLRRGGNVVNFVPALSDVAAVGVGIGTLAGEVSQAADTVAAAKNTTVAAADRASAAADRADATVADRAVIGGTPVSNADYQAALTDTQIMVKGLTQSRTVTLPSAAQFKFGQDLVILDADGSCSEARTIVIQAGAGDTINGQAQIILFDSYQSICLRRGASNLWIRLQ